MIKSSRKKNNLDAHNAAKRNQTHCKWGHAFSGENLMRNARGERKCRTCASATNKSRRYLDGKYVPVKVTLPDVAPTPEVIVAATKNHVLTKTDSLTREEWLKLYGTKPKRVFVDYSKIYVPWL